MSWSTFANVRAHLRTVSRVGHNQAESMWAWPTADTRCALADAGRASTTGGQTAPDDLSEADRQVLALLATGLTDERIAAHLGLGLRTVQRRVRGLMDRLGAGNRFQAGLQAARTGLL